MKDRELKALVEAQADWIIEKRRQLHRIPEKGFAEFKTQKVICDTLDELGIPYITERTWVIGMIEGALPGDVVGLRADIDALPIEEPEGCPFRSEHPGMMHACGHDMHVAILLGAAKVLMSIRDQLPGKVKLLFQPAEETDGGAEPMVAAGAMENPHVDRVYGLHVMPRLPLGTVETRPGTLNASTDSIKITVHGKAGHGVRLVAGMTIAIEPMINLGTWEVRVLEDGWTVVARDGKPSAHYENTVAITDGEPLVLTLP